MKKFVSRQNHQSIGGKEDPMPGIQHKGPLDNTLHENPLAVAPAPPAEKILLKENIANPP
jgi:hypothetical protein